jgi:hypothetical protein
MRPTRALVFAVVASATLAGTALADDRINLTPTLYREQARATAAVRPTSELTTTPSPTVRAPAAPRVVAEATATSAR